MIMVTGGAGFIGSNLHAELHARSIETVVVDRLGDQGKWRNLAAHPPGRIVMPEALDTYLAGAPRNKEGGNNGGGIEAVVHLGAISETTATDGDLVWASNVTLSQTLWTWCAARGVRLIYASSAATYGDGAEGFDDDPARLERLRPLNLYGWSKHAFDLWVHRQVSGGAPVPPQWAGLKFFNVYGPNEYHKGPMISAVKVKHDEILAGHAPRLFRSDRADVADGEQRRDFIWVGDVVDVILWLLATPSVSGLFNLGTGVARSYRELAHAVCDAAGVERRIELIDMPGRLAGHYQSHTQAELPRLRAAGYRGQFTPLEHGVSRYVRDFLTQANPYR